MRLAVVSPFVDKSHGTERCLVEQLTRLSAKSDVEIHLYAQTVRDLQTKRYPAVAANAVIWHKVPHIGGPHLFAYLWWFIANHVQRWWDATARRLRFDVLYSPGINTLDADFVFTHVIFSQLYANRRAGVLRGGRPFSQWFVTLHRFFYYSLLRGLEQVVYRQRELRLAAPSSYTAQSLGRLFGRSQVVVIPHGVDSTVFCPSIRLCRREGARSSLGVSSEQFCVLLIGNDAQNKGLPCLIGALQALCDPNLTLIVLGENHRSEYAHVIEGAGLGDRVQFHRSSADVMQYYAAADAYVAPSLEDAFGLPILEAMACGLPVIASSRAGASELIRHGYNGMVLGNPEDVEELASLLGQLVAEPATCQRMGECAHLSAQQHSWDLHTEKVCQILRVIAGSNSGLKQI